MEKGVLFRHILKKIVHTLFWIISYVDLTLQELRGSGTVKKKSMVERQCMVIRNKGQKSAVIIAFVATLADVVLRCQTDCLATFRRKNWSL
jgi:hypothetical protein